MKRGVWEGFWEWRLQDQVGQAGGRPVEGLGHGGAVFWGRWKTRPQPGVPERWRKERGQEPPGHGGWRVTTAVMARRAGGGAS